MKEYRNLLIALGVMALLTPIGLYLPEIMKAGAAWGEWGIDEIRERIGYAPAGMEKTSDAWKAPLPEYSPPGGEDASLPKRSIYSILSAFLGIAACGGVTYLVARRLAGGGRPAAGGPGGPAPGTPRERLFYETAASRGMRPAGRTHVEKTLREISSFFARAMFREETARRPGVLQGVDPRARLLATLIFLVSVSLARTLPELLAHAALPPLALVLSRIRPGELFGAGFLVAVAFSLLMAAPATLNVFFDGTVVVPLLDRGREWRYGPYFLPAVIGITREGLLTAATFLLRVLSSVAAVLCLTLSTRWVDLLRALRFLRLPAIFLQVIGMTVRYTHALLRHSEEVHLGRKSRTVCRAGIAGEQAWVGSRIARSWERSLHLMEEVSIAMAARGFTGEAKFPEGTWFGAPEWGTLFAVVLFCSGAHAA